MGQDTTKVIGNMGFQFLPKSVTLDDTEGLLRSCFKF